MPWHCAPFLIANSRLLRIWVVCVLATRDGKFVSGENGIWLTDEKTIQELQRKDLHIGVRYGIQLRGVYVGLRNEAWFLILLAWKVWHTWTRQSAPTCSLPPQVWKMFERMMMQLLSTKKRFIRSNHYHNTPKPTQLLSVLLQRHSFRAYCGDNIVDGCP